MSKYDYSYNGNEYKTPPEIYNQALQYYGLDEFDVDVCCSENNIPAKYHIINGIEDGLTAEWGRYNWCNPPFNECEKWVKKAYAESHKGNNTAMIIPVRTERKYWHNYILFEENVYIKWLVKGLRFLDENNNYMGIYKNALAFVYFNAVEGAEVSE